MPRIEKDRLALAGARLGEAALDPGVWPALMEEICEAVGAVGSALLQSEVRTPDIPRTKSVDELLCKYFADGWHIRDVRAQRGVPLLLGGQTVVVDQDLIGENELRSDPFYNEFLREQGFRWFSGVGFWAGSSLWGLCIQRTPQEGSFDTEDKLVMARISGRLTEAATLSKAVGRQVLLGISNALELVGQAAIALDRQGLVLDTNGAAQNLFGNEIGIRERRLWVQDKLAKSRLDNLTDQMRTTDDSAVLRTSPIAVRRERLPPVLIRPLPIPAPARSPFLGARIILILSDLISKSRPDPAVLRQVFGLTPVETRVALIMSTGASPVQVAEEIGIAFETVRSHLKAIFAKTGTHRQGELVALLTTM
jgi:DNA-binding CsgD family transcriptional regulator/PAS domain-containing protein